MAYMFVVVFSYFLGNYLFDLFVALKGRTNARIAMVVFTVVYMGTGIYLSQTNDNWIIAAIMWPIYALGLAYTTQSVVSKS